MSNDPAARIPDALIAGAAMLGLAGIAAYVITSPPAWVSLVALAVGIGAAGVVLGRSGALVPSPRAPSIPGTFREGRPPGWLATATVIVTGLTAGAAWPGPGRPSDLWVACLWAASVALLLVGAWWRPISRPSRARPSWRETLPWLGMVAIAAPPRLLVLDRFPTVLTGDEGTFMVRARLAQVGELDEVFGVGFRGNPNLYQAVSGYVAALVGSPPADFRILGAVVGTLGVVATWRLGRILLGPEAAAAGAVILATMPLHLHFSRSALNNITDATVLAGALLFLMRAVRGGGRLDAALAGVILGLGLFGYFGGRALPGIT